MRRALVAIGAVVALLVGVVVLRAASLQSRQPEAAAPAAGLAVDATAVAERLAGGLRYRTVSYSERERLDRPTFLAFREYLAAVFPRVHTSLRVETVGDYSLLYTWEGRDRNAPGVLLAAHHDVVPVEDESSWTHLPYAGEIVDGVVWGRGAIDDKGSLFCQLEAVDALLAEGFVPERTIHLAFGHDEEVGGDDGAVAIAAALDARGTKLSIVVDEGGVVSEGMMEEILPGAVAVIGVAEKGSISVKLSVEADGGHSSMPPPQSAVGILSAAVTELEAGQMPARLTDTTRQFLEFLAPELPFGARAALGNLWLFRPALLALAGNVPTLNAMVRTTTAATVFHGGVKTNVLPRKAEAVVNFRILPGDDIDAVMDHVRRTIDDERIALSTVRTSRNPSPESPVDSEAFGRLQRSVRAHFPDAIVVPYLVVGGTDARHYTRLTDNVYRFSPYRLGPDTMPLLHGRNERIAVDNLGTAVRFYHTLLTEVAR